MVRKLSKKILLLVVMMCMFVSAFSIIALGSEFGNEEAGSNGTMISELDKYSGLETYLVGQFNAKNTGDINVSAYKIPGESGSAAQKILDLVNAVLYKNPELVHVNMSKGVSVTIRGGYIETLKITAGYFSYNQAVFDAEVSKVMNLIKNDMSDFEKVLTVHNYLCMDVEYAYDEFASGTVTELQHSALGAIIDKRAVCDGYSKAFSYYMDKLGITSYLVTGTATTGGVVVSHAWNQVKLDGKWYFVDVSWDDPVPDWYGNIKYDYFLKSASDYSDHTWEVNDFEICNSTTYDDSSNVFWKGISSQMFCIDGVVYYLKVVDNKAFLVSHNLSSNALKDEGTRLDTIEHKWKAFGGSNSYYPGNYSRLAYEDGKLYYSTSDAIYSYDISSKTKAKAYDADVTKGYVYGLKSSEGILYYQTAKTPNEFDGATNSIKIEEISGNTDPDKKKEEGTGTEEKDTDKIKFTGKLNLSKKEYVYTGKYIKPAVTFKGLKKDVDYKVTYSNNKNIGIAKITVTGIGKYDGTMSATFKIVPKKVTFSKLTSPKKKVLKATWKKVSGTGYEILVSNSKNFKKSTKYTIKSAKKLNITINKKLKSGKKYYVKVRAYKVVKGKKYYGSYSKVLYKKVK